MSLSAALHLTILFYRNIFSLSNSDFFFLLRHAFSNNKHYMLESAAFNTVYCHFQPVSVQIDAFYTQE